MTRLPTCLHWALRLGRSAELCDHTVKAVLGIVDDGMCRRNSRCCDDGDRHRGLFEQRIDQCVSEGLKRLGKRERCRELGYCQAGLSHNR